MINRTLLLILFFMSTVVLYYQNQQLVAKNQALQTKLNSKKKEQSKEVIFSQKVDNENNISTILIDLQNKLQECLATKTSKQILHLAPIEEKKKDFNAYIQAKEFAGIKPYTNDQNYSKKNMIEVMPDVIFDKEKEDIGLRLELKKQF